MTKTELNLEKIENEIKKDSFLNSKGLGNEVSYYIFDYSPQDELTIRRYLEKLKKKDKKIRDGYKIVVYDVYDIMIDLLEKENLRVKIGGVKQLSKNHKMQHIKNKIEERRV